MEWKHSELLENKSSVFQCLSTIQQKQCLGVHTGNDITRRASPSPRSSHYVAQRPLSRSPQGPIEPQSDSLSTPVPVVWTLTAQSNCSSWSGDSVLYTHHGIAVVFITAPLKRIRGDSWKEPVSYLSLLLLIAKPSQSPWLARTTRLGLRTVAAPLLDEQRSNDSASQAFPGLPFYPRVRQGPSLGNL